MGHSCENHPDGTVEKVKKKKRYGGSAEPTAVLAPAFLSDADGRKRPARRVPPGE